MQSEPAEGAVAALDEPAATPERIWTPHMATTTAAELQHLAASARSAQVCAALPPAAAVSGRAMLVWVLKEPLGLHLRKDAPL